MNVSQRAQARRGFTLIEILVAIAIVAIAAVFVAPNIYRALGFGKENATRVNLRGLQNGVDAFYLAMQAHPDSLRDLVRKPKDERLAKKWREPFLRSKDVPNDGWGNPFRYKKTPGAEKPYELYSYGPKGKGSPKEEWISVWDL